MRGTSLLVTTIVIGCCWLNQANTFAQTYAPSAAAEQLVVLKNGEILRGIVSQNSKQVFVQTALGSRLVLTVEQVDFVESTMEGAYWGKLARTKASDTEGQKQLFFWCLKHKLIEQAQNQFDILVNSKITATDLANLDRQLNVAITQRQNAAIRLAQKSKSLTPALAPAFAPATASPAKSNLDSAIASSTSSVDTQIFRPLPKMSEPNNSLLATNEHGGDFQPNVAPQSNPQPGLVRQVGYDEPIKYKTISLNDLMQSTGSPAITPIDLSNSFQPGSIKRIPKNSNSAVAIDASGNFRTNEKKDERDDRVMISVAELDRETRSMPKESVGHYRRRVENFLINKCSNCHDTESRIMPLMRVAKGRAIPRRLSQRNHHNFLRYVNRDSVFESPLLVAAMKPHADLEKPLFEPGSKELRNLQIWLALLSNKPDAVYRMPINNAGHPINNPDSTMDNEGILIDHAPGVSPESQSTQLPKEILPVKPDRIDDDFANSSIEFPTLTKEIPTLEPRVPSFKPVDPFDPEIFNRLHRDK